jgi:16S rRNA G966 N2-methylase RsmD
LKLFQYLQYFFYIVINWNWKIAFITLVQEVRGEKKYGINTTGADELKKIKAQGIDISHSTIYMPVSYQVLENAFDHINSKNKNHFLDIGCGKGRALCVAAHRGFKKITGVDFSKKFCEHASINMKLTGAEIYGTEFTVITADAAEFAVPADVDCIFMFNPFDDTVMEKVAANINKSLTANPREMTIVYANPVCKNLFLKKNFTETYHNKNHEYFEVSILSFRH